MTERIDFSRNAAVYDRRHGASLPEDAVRDIAEAAALDRTRRILDVGAGTGRVAVPLATLGYDVVAVDPARRMLDVLIRKAAQTPLHLLLAEGRSLPFPSSAFGGVVLSRVLYLMPDWREVLGEVSRVLAPDGCLLHEWGNGSESEGWVQIRERARALFQHEGVAQPFHPGARSETEVYERLQDFGFSLRATVPIGPGPAATLDEFLTLIASGECSYTWNVPADVQHRTLPALREWAERSFDLHQPMPIPQQMVWRVYRRWVRNDGGWGG